MILFCTFNNYEGATRGHGAYPRLAMRVWNYQYWGCRPRQMIIAFTQLKMYNISEKISLM